MYVREKCLASASAASSFKESIAFAHGLLQLKGAEDVLSSGRNKGFCNRLKASKKPTRQARVLTCKQVIQLESTVMTSDDLQDSIMAGYCLLCLFSRARWSDIQFPQWLTVDRDENFNGFYQIDVRLTKTSSTAEKKSMLLPVTGILDGLSINKWFDTWSEKREQTGLKTFSTEVPVMPGVLINGKWDKAPISTTQGSKWLRELLLLAGSTPEQVKGISTHSLKATTLSWASKYGLPLQDRTLLGYHVIEGASSTLHYSRDALSGPLRSLQKVMQAIRDGEFIPDETRSGYFKLARKTVADPDNGDSSSSSSSQASDSDTEVLSDEERVATTNTTIANLPNVNKRRKLDKMQDHHCLYIHKRWRTLHLADDNVCPKMICGRVKSAAYQLVAREQEFPYVRCKDCFRE